MVSPIVHPIDAGVLVSDLRIAAVIAPIWPSNLSDGVVPPADASICSESGLQFQPAALAPLCQTSLKPGALGAFLGSISYRLCIPRDHIAVYYFNQAC
jgi:hypothetical protein